MWKLATSFYFAVIHTDLYKSKTIYLNALKAKNINQWRWFSSGKKYNSQTKKASLVLSNHITVAEMSNKLGVDSVSLIKLLKDYGYCTTKGPNTVLDFEIAEAIADEYNFNVVMQDAHCLKRPPIVTIMGHVDHGKTTLLDYLRRTSVAAQEAGGITQSIGAFSVQVPGLDNTKVTFIDTPGHAAFSLMRSRGAHLTDIVVLVIAADDGIMAQTKECIQHIKEAQVPLIVAINKIDKPNVNPAKIRRDLLTNGIHLEEFGGTIKSINVSALKGTNIDKFLILLSEVSKEHKIEANYNGPVEAVVLEAEKNKLNGTIASLLVKQGTLKVGHVLLAGNSFAKVRQLYDHNGVIMKQAFPSEPCQVMGWKSLPKPGDVAIQVKNESEAQSIIKLKEIESRPVNVKQSPLQKAIGKKSISSEMKGGRSKKIPMRVLMRQEAAAGVKDDTVQNSAVNIVLKADSSGSLEAIVNIINSFHSSDIKLNILEASVGPINESDLQMASIAKGIVYSFNLDTDKSIALKAEQMQIPLRSHNIIYKLLDVLKDDVESFLPYKNKETVIGEAVVINVFKLTGARKGVAAGCQVLEGSLDTSDNYVWKVLRNNEEIFKGSLKSLRRGSTDITMAKKLSECGVILNNFIDFQEGDSLLCVKSEKIKDEVEWKV